MHAAWKVVNGLLLVIAFSSTLYSPIVAAGSPSVSISIGSTGSIQRLPLKIGIYTVSYNFQESSASIIASTFDMSQSWYPGATGGWTSYQSTMQQVLAANPKYKFLLYRNCEVIYRDVNNVVWNAEWDYCNSQGWFLKDVNGNYATESAWGWTSNYMVDVGNPAYQQWLATELLDWLTAYPQFAGVMADNSIKYNADDFMGMSTTPVINPRTNQVWTDAEVYAAFSGLLNAIIDKMPADKLLLANGVYTGNNWQGVWAGAVGYRTILNNVPRLTGIYSEGTFMYLNNYGWLQEADWKNSVDYVAEMQDIFLAGHPERTFNAECHVAYAPAGVSREQVIIYGFSSMLLAVKYSVPQNCFSAGYSEAMLPTSAEYSLLQKLRNIDFGEPLGNYYKVTGTSIYARNFTKAKVLVNPTATAYHFTLDKAYTDINGAILSGTLTVSPHTGLILIA